jgi:hypothetical protein
MTETSIGEFYLNLGLKGTFEKDAAKAIKQLDKLEISLNEGENTAGKLAGSMEDAGAFITNIGDGANYLSECLEGSKTASGSIGLLVSGIQALPGPLQSAIDSGLDLTESFSGMGSLLTNLAPGMQLLSAIQTSTVVPSLMATAAAGWAAAAPWLPLILAIGGVIAVAYLLYTNWETISAGLSAIWEGILGIAGQVWNGIVTAVSGAIDMLTSIFFNFTPLGIFVSHFDEILNFLGSLKDVFYNAGAAIIRFLVDGIASLISAPAELISGAFGLIGDLIPHSPAKTGPLSKMPNWDAYLVEPMRSVEPAMQEAAMAAVAPVAEVSSSVGKGTSTHNYDNSMSISQISFQKDADISEFWRQRDEQIRQSRIRRGVRTL